MSGGSLTPGRWISRALAHRSPPSCVLLWPDTSKPGVHMRRLDHLGEFSEADARLLATSKDLLAACQAALWEDSGLACSDQLREAIVAALGHVPPGRP
jgi:hypothetical protein